MTETLLFGYLFWQINPYHITRYVRKLGPLQPNLSLIMNIDWSAGPLCHVSAGESCPDISLSHYKKILNSSGKLISNSFPPFCANNIYDMTGRTGRDPQQF